MNARRRQLGKTWKQIAIEADISTETLRALRLGKNEPSDLTKSGLERALRWKSGSLDAVLAREKPVLAGETERPAVREETNPGEQAAMKQMDLLLAAMSEAARRAAREEVAADIAEMRERIAHLEEQLRKETS
jgi:hypothetical protein